MLRRRGQKVRYDDRHVLGVLPPMTVGDLLEAGGPAAFIAEAERKAGSAAARFWLNTLEQARPKIDAGDSLAAGLVDSWIEALQRRLNPRAPADEGRDRVEASYPSPAHESLERATADAIN